MPKAFATKLSQSFNSVRPFPQRRLSDLVVSWRDARSAVVGERPQRAIPRLPSAQPECLPCSNPAARDPNQIGPDFAGRRHSFEGIDQGSVFIRHYQF